MPRLLLVDDDRFLLRALEKLLVAEGYYCKCVVTANDARRAVEEDQFDLLVLDVGLPDQDGFSLCRQIRATHRMPILFLSAHDQNADTVIGLEVGADDYMSKPFAPRELVARIRAHLRRSAEYNKVVCHANQIVIGRLVVDEDRRDARVNGEFANLTDREYELLHLLARHQEKALAADWIFENVWGYDAELNSKSLAVYVRRLRLKVEKDPDRPQLLVTVRGFGYKLTAGDKEFEVAGK